MPRWLPRKTKKKSILDYKNLYEGPEFDIDYQYAQIWIVSLMAFIFGPLLPQMFLWAFVGMIILEVTNRLRLAYSVKRFPKYSEELNQWSMSGLKAASIGYLLIGSHLFANQQVFHNEVYANKSASAYNAPVGHEHGLNWE